MRFTKMHGLGNDYIYVNGFEERVEDPAALASRIADRHKGVGGDGLILILPPGPGPRADVRMRIFNADGSEAEMCGNGVRCVAKFAHDHKLTEAKPMRVRTGAGVLSIDFTTDGEGRLALASVDMGEPVLEAKRIPVDLPGEALSADGRVIDVPLSRCVSPGEPERWMKEHGLHGGMTCVSMGNPHAVIYCDRAADVPLERIGPILENQPIFPHRMNVHFVEVHSRAHATMRTWERGSGATQACGTGACAVCVAGVLTDHSDRKLLAHLPGGDLNLDWREADGHVRMTGPATEVFTGNWPA